MSCVAPVTRTIHELLHTAEVPEGMETHVKTPFAFHHKLVVARDAVKCFEELCGAQDWIMILDVLYINKLVAMNIPPPCQLHILLLATLQVVLTECILSWCIGKPPLSFQ